MALSNLKYPRIVGFQLIERIGGGGFSTVYKAVNLEAHRVAACKVVALTSETTPQDRKSLDKEMRVHTAMKHVHVLEFYNAVIVEDEPKAKYFPAVYMLLELASGGDLFDKIAPDLGVDEEVAQYYFNQLISGLHYIHEQGVCHRDLKPENLLLDAAGRLKISDFGLCSVFRHKESGRERLLTERCGSLPYVAPELNSTAPYHAEPIDIWGAGVILFTLLCGNTPWDEPSGHSHEFRRYVRGEILDDPPWNRLTTDSLSLIQGILNINPAERMTIPEIMVHPWCLRPSQVEAEGQAALAQRLTQSLHTTGDMGVIDPHYTLPEQINGDEDEIISSTYQSQFTKSLLLFSQTQRGRRYTPHLTRFYSSLGPEGLMELVMTAVTELGVKSKLAQPDPSEPERLRLRVGGYDKRHEVFKGWIEIEPFVYQGIEGSFCIMQRDQGNPISWRQLWKAVVQDVGVGPHVLKRT
ncbi:CAMK/CAMKL/CHK1 protein kinase [Fomitiporia mediterranea MF3/22]|uniref:CAMK/CAMKL/CHK1 protein kinase n=1 Tax=Fomitiporia mediterranea (strain MF3/22) TaxID=694068 RepID=UPI00044078CE|nr:CAMK/CAMKL/CHK1 protein kinase [Fomitiporia mediterranea MF3/22]EJD07738.1 CAMK/CAMKL/CHK1 protein kinase [Fomitiporia mediterranea MF3/22]